MQKTTMTPGSRAAQFLRLDSWCITASRVTRALMATILSGSGDELGWTRLVSKVHVGCIGCCWAGKSKMTLRPISAAESRVECDRLTRCLRLKARDNRRGYRDRRWRGQLGGRRGGVSHLWGSLEEDGWRNSNGRRVREWARLWFCSSG
jgi:hypothetical protein